MEGWSLLALEVMFSGCALGFGVWQLVSVRREMRRDAEHAASEKAPAADRQGARPSPASAKPVRRLTRCVSASTASRRQAAPRLGTS
jgi:hypothetical protein